MRVAARRQRRGDALALRPGRAGDGDRRLGLGSTAEPPGRGSHRHRAVRASSGPRTRPTWPTRRSSGSPTSTSLPVDRVHGRVLPASADRGKRRLRRGWSRSSTADEAAGAQGPRDRQRSTTAGLLRRRPSSAAPARHHAPAHPPERGCLPTVRSRAPLRRPERATGSRLPHGAATAPGCTLLGTCRSRSRSWPPHMCSTTRRRRAPQRTSTPMTTGRFRRRGR